MPLPPFEPLSTQDVRGLPQAPVPVGRLEEYARLLGVTPQTSQQPQIAQQGGIPGQGSAEAAAIEAASNVERDVAARVAEGRGDMASPSPQGTTLAEQAVMGEEGLVYTMHPSGVVERTYSLLPTGGIGGRGAAPRADTQVSGERTVNLPIPEEVSDEERWSRTQRQIEMLSQAALTREQQDELAAVQLEAWQNLRSDEEKLRALNEDTTDRVRRDISTLRQQINGIRGRQIDPDHFYASRSAGQRFAAVIGVALQSGLQTRYPHAQQTALAIINAAIDRDLQAQAENMRNQQFAVGATQSLLQTQLQLWGDERSALLAARALHNQAVVNQLQTFATQHAGTQAEQTARTLIAEMEHQQALHQRELAENSYRVALSQQTATRRELAGQVAGEVVDNLMGAPAQPQAPQQPAEAPRTPQEPPGGPGARGVAAPPSERPAEASRGLPGAAGVQPQAPQQLELDRWYTGPPPFTSPPDGTVLETPDDPSAGPIRRWALRDARQVAPARVPGHVSERVRGASEMAPRGAGPRVVVDGRAVDYGTIEFDPNVIATPQARAEAATLLHRRLQLVYTLERFSAMLGDARALAALAPGARFEYKDQLEAEYGQAFRSTVEDMHAMLGVLHPQDQVFLQQRILGESPDDQSVWETLRRAPLGNYLGRLKANTAASLRRARANLREPAIGAVAHVNDAVTRGVISQQVRQELLEALSPEARRALQRDFESTQARAAESEQGAEERAAERESAVRGR